MKVRKADSSAIPTANGATHFRRTPPPESASDGSNDGAEVVSAVVIPAIGDVKELGPASGGLMHSYHNVAELRQFRGVPAAKPIVFQRLKHRTIPRLTAAAVNLDVEIPDLLSQRVAVEAKQVGRADLVAARRGGILQWMVVFAVGYAAELSQFGNTL